MPKRTGDLLRRHLEHTRRFDNDKDRFQVATNVSKLAFTAKPADKNGIEQLFYPEGWRIRGVAAHERCRFVLDSHHLPPARGCKSAGTNRK